MGGSLRFVVGCLGSLNGTLFVGHQAIQMRQMYGKFEGFPIFFCIVWVGNIMTLWSCMSWIWVVPPPWMPVEWSS